MVDIKIVKTDIGKNFEKALKDIHNKALKVGWFENSKYENGTSVAHVATIQEFGAPSKNIPPRPFMRPTVLNQKNNWLTLIRKGMQNVLEGKEPISNVLEKIGFKVEGDIKIKISRIFEPPLKESTIKARLRKYKDKKTIGNLTKPLIDSGIMFATITHTVEDE